MTVKKKIFCEQQLSLRYIFLISIIIISFFTYAYLTAGIQSKSHVTPFVGFVSFAPTITGAAVEQIGTDPISTSMLVIVLSFLALVIILLILAILVISRHHKQVNESHLEHKDKLEPAHRLEQNPVNLQVELTPAQKREAKHLTSLSKNLESVQAKLATLQTPTKKPGKVVSTMPTTRGHHSEHNSTLRKEHKRVTKALTSLNNSKSTVGSTLFGSSSSKKAKKDEHLRSIEKSLAKVREDLQ